MLKGGAGGESRGADLASSAHYRSRSASASRAAPASSINAPPLAPLLVQGCLLPSSAQTLFRSRFRPSMSDKTKEPFYSQGPPPKIGKWEGFKIFLWNGETGQFLGRTAGSWGESFKSSVLIGSQIEVSKTNINIKLILMLEVVGFSNNHYVHVKLFITSVYCKNFVSFNKDIE